MRSSALGFGRWGAALAVAGAMGACISADRSAVRPGDAVPDDDAAAEVSADVAVEATLIGADGDDSGPADEIATLDVAPVDTLPNQVEVVADDGTTLDASEITATDVVACGSGKCLIDGVCYGAGAADPSGSGRICDPLCGPDAWAPNCAALSCLVNAFCDGGNCTSLDQDPNHACFAGSENRCYGPLEQAEGVDWPDEPLEPWPTIARNTSYRASLNPLGPPANVPPVGDPSGDIDWVRWPVTIDGNLPTPDASPVASAAIANYTGVPVEFCVLVSCGQALPALPDAVNCSAGAQEYDRQDATRRGCCMKVSPDAELRNQTVWTRPKCKEPTVLLAGFAMVRTPSTDGGACGRYDLTVDLPIATLPAPARNP